MKLRTRVIVWLMAIVLPASTVFTLHRWATEKRNMQSRHAERVAGRMQERTPRRCLRAPEHWRYERRGVVGYAYSVDARSQNPRAPALPHELLDSLELEEDEPIHRRQWFGPFDGMTVFRTGRDGNCAVIALYWGSRPMPGRLAGGVLTQSAVLALLLVLTGALISYPLVARIRRLTQSVAGLPDEGPGLEAELAASDELGELARAFASAHARVRETIADLRKRDEALETYIANATHDMALPVTVLTHRLRKMQELGPPEEFTPLLQTALEETRYLSGLLGNLAISAKLEASEIYFQPYAQDLVVLVARVGQRMQPIAENAGIELNFAVPDGSFVVDCDATLVEQALGNVLQNAIQYNARGGHVAMVLECSEQSFELRIVDDGPGIAPELLADVLKRHVRSKQARDRRPDGRGLGLAIADKVCRLHQWQLSIANVSGLAGRGLEVTIVPDPTPEGPESLTPRAQLHCLQRNPGSGGD